MESLFSNKGFKATKRMGSRHKYELCFPCNKRSIISELIILGKETLLHKFFSQALSSWIAV
jgi:hypothetical protein